MLWLASECICACVITSWLDHMTCNTSKCRSIPSERMKQITDLLESDIMIRYGTSLVVCLLAHILRAGLFMMSRPLTWGQTPCVSKPR